MPVTKNSASYLKTATNIVNIRDAVAPSTGQVMTASSATTGIWLDPYTSIYRQAIINGGGYDISNIVQQRSDFTGASNTWSSHTTYYGPDRWLIYSSDNTTMGLGRASGGIIQCYKGNVSAATNKSAIMQILEASSSYPFRGKTMSFGFIPGAVQTARDLTVFILAMKTGGTADSIANAPVANFQASGTRPTFDTTNYTVLYEADIDDATINGVNRVTGTTITVPSDAKNIIFGVVNKDSFVNGDAYGGFYITEVQLNVSNVTLPFMPKSYGVEERDCKRFYERIVPGAAGHIFATGQSDSTTSIWTWINYLPKRSNPVVTASSGNNLFASRQGGTGLALAGSALAFSGSGPTGSPLIVTGSGYTAGHAVTIDFNSSSAYIEVNSEL